MEVALRQASPAVALDALRAGVALVFDSYAAPLPTGGLRRRELLTEPFLAALPRGHRLAGAAPLALGRLRRERWIVGSQSRGSGPIERACLAAGFQPSVVAAADDQPTIQALVAAGVGVTLIPRLATADGRPDVALVELRHPPTRRVATVTLDAAGNPAAEALLAVVQGVATGSVVPSSSASAT